MISKQTTEERQKPLTLSFHGRIIDQLGLQMYQSPVAAVAEMVSNAWDADAENVWIEMPNTPVKKSELVVRDNGRGMTYAECNNRFLEAGYDKREGDPLTTSKGGRALQGRKGIGKFAGFGIAQKITVDTTSSETGERTVFVLDVNDIRGDGSTYSGGAIPIECKRKDPPNPKLVGKGRTEITLSDLLLKRRPNPKEFATSMARRFLLSQESDTFVVHVDSKKIPKDPDLAGVEFTFPGDYTKKEIPDGLVIEDGWGVEDVAGSGLVRWQFRFYEDTIENQEMRGVTVFAKGKLAQRPFTFNMTQGVTAQNGLEYLYGRVDATYLDKLDDDVISTERQRINWEHDDVAPVLEWGQKRTRQLLRLWNNRRNADKIKVIGKKLEAYADRLSKYSKYEVETARKALTRFAEIDRMTTEQFGRVSDALLTALEQGYLKDLIRDIANAQELDADGVLKLMGEAEVLSALAVAESVKARGLIIAGLEERIRSKELENPLRDYVAKHPWLLAPRWQTFRIERRLDKLVDDIRDKVDRAHPAVKEQRRVDLTLEGGPTLLAVEFMRPGVTVDRDHLNRFEYYVSELRAAVRPQTQLSFTNVEGLLVADKLDKSASNVDLIERLAAADMRATDWETLLSVARAQWSDYLDVLVDRAPDDSRVQALGKDSEDKTDVNGDNDNATKATP